jgi:hypothetical protein
MTKFICIDLVNLKWSYVLFLKLDTLVRYLPHNNIADLETSLLMQVVTFSILLKFDLMNIFDDVLFEDFPEFLLSTNGVFIDIKIKHKLIFLVFR